MTLDPKVFFSKRTTDLLIIINNIIKNTKSNKNYKKVFRPPGGDYTHLSKPKVRRRPRPSITGARQSLS
jgi:chorismate synthase